MSSLLDSGPPASLADLSERRAAVGRLLADLDAEIFERFGEVPGLTNLCGHCSAPPVFIVPGGTECATCGLKRFRAEDTAREARTEFAAHFGLLPDGG